MRPLLKRQEKEIEPATYDARANNRSRWSIGAPQHYLFGNFDMLDVDVDNRIFSDSGLNFSDSSRIQFCNLWRPVGLGFLFFEGRTDSDFANQESDHLCFEGRLTSEIQSTVAWPPL